MQSLPQLKVLFLNFLNPQEALCVDGHWKAVSLHRFCREPEITNVQEFGPELHSLLSRETFWMHSNSSPNPVPRRRSDTGNDDDKEERE